MKKYGVRTAAYGVFEDKDSADEYLKNCDYPVVIKADGLAAGKGVVICEKADEAFKTIEEFMVKDIFKGSGKKVVIEEFLEGVEASILSITDGETVLPFVSAKDHKNIYDGNMGPNTGGMGAIAPNPYCTREVLDAFEKDIMIPTLNGIKSEELDYTGIIFFGIMITKKGTYLLEYNVRMGDPETQAVLPLMKSDFVELVNAALDKKLKDFKIKWEDKACCCVVAASGGYPGAYKTGYEINGIDKIENKAFIAGAVDDNGALKTSGGRVLVVSATGSDIEDARNAVYGDMEKVKFKDIYYRKDIGRIY
jgi:phosphoribosylamine--glycine ligase